MTMSVDHKAKQYLSREEAADFMRQSVRQFDRYAKSKAFATIKLGRRVLVDAEELERFMREQSK